MCRNVVQERRHDLGLPARTDARPAVVLVVSDRPRERHALLTSVEATGARAASADNVHDAVALLRCMVFDLVIADEPQRPVIDAIRTDDRTAAVRCVLATSSPHHEDAERPVAVDVLALPFAPDDVARIVRRVVADVTSELAQRERATNAAKPAT
ncbi:Hypothetical protein I5071_56910 [Sandaracinus amylolyticus]|nr:Hypothetical protein I5071_56910 [Sandaracinus amylolyticus]